ncbi:cell surface protein [Comamonas flocculans]|uniref:Cell surface protein n=1 Tax=Comamonas flocculans TaxID=2597701 RepID=A0A5B8RWZ7_9BURK|nr:cell surface protein [Comamonas flocculans]QEA13244.1 cell surface protein [Comamonas flocculans]
MKKNVLALSIAAMIGSLGFAGVASAGTVITNPAPGAALEVTPTGIGHILLVPYFSTQNGNVSLLNITNTDQTNGKAVKLRYRGAANSDDIYDITIYLSPGDMWSANVSQVDGVSTLVTNDNSCTLPADVNVRFGTARLTAEDSLADNKAGTLEGYIEILNMADVPPGSALYTSIKHVKQADGSYVAPCATMPSQKTDLADYPAAQARGYDYPTGGLMANWSIINLDKAGSFTGDATAIIPDGGANIVFSPQEEEATVTAAAAALLTADPLLAAPTATLTAKNYDFPDLSTPYIGVIAPIDQAHMLSHALATASITNEYMTSPDVGFATDWTFSMPSRRYNVALNYKTSPASVVYATGGAYFTAANVTRVGDQICVNSKFEDLEYFNTEEGKKTTKPGGYVVSPQRPGVKPGLNFCGETSVLTFNNPLAEDQATPVLGALIARQNLQMESTAGSTDVYTDGWMSIKTAGNPGVGGDLGLPVIGHSFAKALAFSASLGGIWKHRTSTTNIVAVP